MKIREIWPILDSIAPFDLAASWDRSGLNVGSLNSDFSSITLALDLSAQVIRNAPDNTLFITHHPLIFSPLKSFDTSSYPANLIKDILAKNCTHIALHTNFDLAHLNRFVLDKILGFEPISGDGDEPFLLEFSVNQPFDDFALFIKQKLNIEHLRVVKSHDFIAKAALCTGSGSELIASTDADCLLTGDIKYHAALEASQNGRSIIDINHFESEQFFAECLAELLAKHNIKVAKNSVATAPNSLHNEGVFAIIADFKNPFSYI